MEEKNVTKISLSTFLLLIAVIIIAVMGYFIYKLNNDKTIEVQRSTDLQAQVNILNSKVQDLNVEKNNINETINSTLKNTASNKNENSDDKIAAQNLSKELNGVFFNEKSKKNSDHYEFFKNDKKVNYLNGNILYSGIYTVSENNVTLNLTNKVTVGDFNNESINESKVLTFISDNTLQDVDNTKYINKNTISGAFCSENSINVGGNSTDDSWYTFNYNGGVRYSDSKNELYGTYEIKENVITITYYFTKNDEMSVLEEYNESKLLKINNDDILDEEINMNYKVYADGW